jgi:RimJ/RimL family protein N-acetyltransferase
MARECDDAGQLPSHRPDPLATPLPARAAATNRGLFSRGLGRADPSENMLSVTSLAQLYSGMTEDVSFPELKMQAVSRQPALILRPWPAMDIAALIAELSRDYLMGGMWSAPDERPFKTVLRGGAERTGPMGERDAERWLGSQARGWHDRDRLCFAVLETDEVGGCVLAGNVGLKNRDGSGRIGERETAEIGYWTAVAARGRGVAPAAVSAVTDWVFDAFGGTSLRRIMLVHNDDNQASCRVAQKAGYPFLEFSPANPPHWFEDGHIHMRRVAAGQRGLALACY